MIEVNRQCPYCKQDRGMLQIIRFYDADAILGSTERKYSRAGLGFLNQRVMCGDSDCLLAAMEERKTEVES